MSVRFLHTFSILAVAGIIAVTGYVAYQVAHELADYFPSPSGATLSEADMTAGFRRVELLRPGGETVTGNYAPSAHGERPTILFLHGTSADRFALMPEARALVELGFGALLVDFPGHGNSTGSTRWATPEEETVTAAIDWLRLRTSDRLIGVYAFSFGTQPAVQAIARSQATVPLVLAGTFPNIYSIFVAQSGHLGILRWGGWYLAAALMGSTADRHQVESNIMRLKARRVLFISGDRDLTVPSRLSREVFAQCNCQKEFWTVAGAHHGQYLAAARQEWVRRVNNIFHGTN